MHDLGAIGDNRAVEPLIELLKERPPGPVPPQVAFNTVQTRKEAVWALRRFRDPRARAALKNAFAEDPDWGVYHAAHEALRRFDRPDGLDRFGVQLGDFDGQLDDTVILAVEKKPEPPEGAEAYVQRHPPNPAPQWAGPWVEDYAPAAAIDKARASWSRDAIRRLRSRGETDVFFLFHEIEGRHPAPSSMVDCGNRPRGGPRAESRPGTGRRGNEETLRVLPGGDSASRRVGPVR